MNEIERAKYEDELETEYDALKFKETYNILKKAGRLKPKNFKLVEKKELQEELQKTIKHLTTLLLKLESKEVKEW